MKRLILFFALVAGCMFLSHGTARATCAVPYTFTNGQLADANQVNANMTTLENCINTVPSSLAIKNSSTGISVAIPLGMFSAKIYGAYGDASHDDTSAVQAAINAACPSPGGAAIGTVYLDPGTYFISSTLQVQCSNLWIVGAGEALAAGSGAPTTTLKWHGSAGGTLIAWGAPNSSTGSANIENGGMMRVNLSSNSGSAAYGIVLKGDFGQTFEHISYDGFSSVVFWLTYNTNLTIPGTSSTSWSYIHGADFAGVTFWLDGSYNDHFENLHGTWGSADYMHFGGGTTTNDESDTNSLVHVALLQANGYTSGYGLDLDCDTSSNTIVGFDSGATTAGHSLIARGTSTCATLNGATYGNRIYGFTDAQVTPTVEAGAGIAIDYSDGQQISYSTTAPAATLGDLQAYENATTGAVIIGGASSSCALDYGKTRASYLTAPCTLQLTTSTQYGISIPANGSLAIGTDGAASDFYVSNSDGQSVQKTVIGSGSSNFGSCPTGVSIGASVFDVAAVGKPTGLCIDLNGNAAIHGVFGANGTYVPPVYTATGGPVASTLHGVIASCTLSSNACTITLSGAAAFSSASSYACGGSQSFAYQGAMGIEQTSGTSITINSGFASGAVYVVCFGT